ncbi:hypothetical protein WN943_018303 [Citrus x changshan-huyou]
MNKRKGKYLDEVKSTGDSSDTPEGGGLYVYGLQTRLRLQKLQHRSFACHFFLDLLIRISDAIYTVGLVFYGTVEIRQLRKTCTYMRTSSGGSRYETN